MRKLRVLMFIFCGLISISDSFAQTFEIKTGVNFSNHHYKDRFETELIGNKLAPRFLIGVSTEFPLTEIFSIETGLLFSTKGYTMNKNFALYSDSEPLYISQKVILNYLDIPLSIKYATPFHKTTIFGEIGPYAGIAINGVTKTDEFSDGIIERKTYNHQIGSNGNWKRFDYGLQAGIGIVYEKFVFGVDYVFGLADISQRNDFKSKNRIIGLTLGYKFRTSNTTHNAQQNTRKSGFGASLTEN